MDGAVVPEGVFSDGWLSFFENPGLAQFDHRMIAYAVVLFAWFFWSWLRTHSKPAPMVRRAANTVLAITLVQVTLGVVTLLYQVPVALAALHQVVAALLFSAALWLTFELRRQSFIA
jgi:cytochrome c oxidase assembly protein subunit 15